MWMEVPLGKTTTLEVGLAGREGFVATDVMPVVDVDTLVWLATAENKHTHKHTFIGDFAQQSWVVKGKNYECRAETGLKAKFLTQSYECSAWSKEEKKKKTKVLGIFKGTLTTTKRDGAQKASSQKKFTTTMMTPTLGESRQAELNIHTFFVAELNRFTLLVAKLNSHTFLVAELNPYTLLVAQQNPLTFFVPSESWVHELWVLLGSFLCCLIGCLGKHSLRHKAGKQWHQTPSFNQPFWRCCWWPITGEKKNHTWV